MDDLLIDKEQWVSMDLGTKPTTMSKEYWKKIERKEISTIHLCLSDSILLNVFGDRRHYIEVVGKVREFVSAKVPSK